MTPFADLPTGLVKGTPGIYRLGRPPADLVRRLRASGWTIGSLERAYSKEAVLRGIGQALDFPDYYGANLDALWDCLADLDRPTALVWSGWQDMAVYHADDWARLRHVLGERVTQEPPFAVVLV